MSSTRHIGAKSPEATNSKEAKMNRILIISVALFVGTASAYSNPNDANAEVRNLANEIKEDEGYSYHFDTTNGIAAQESGVGGQYAAGSSQYYSPEGQLIQLTYTANENGFQPQGDHLPTPPPIPEAILRALEYIRAHPEQNEEDYAAEYGAESNQYAPAVPAQPSNRYLTP